MAARTWAVGRMVSVDPGDCALAALGEDVSITPASPPDATAATAKAIVQRNVEAIDGGVAVLRDLTIWMAAAPTVYSVGDAVICRNLNWRIQSLEHGTTTRPGSHITLRDD